MIRASSGEEGATESSSGEFILADAAPFSGASFGELVHRTLERANLADPASAGHALEDALATIAGGTPGLARDFALGLDDAARARVRGFIERVLRDREIAQLARAPRLRREVPFILPVAGDFLTGTADVLIEGSDGGLWIVDYKTDRAVPKNPGALPLRYRRQALLSSFAIAQIAGRPVRAFRFLYVAADPVVAITIEIDDDSHAEARSLVQKIRSGEIEPPFQPADPSSRSQR
jgi:ATP-dependent exoDNAse (exonuclease V) beta subunit